MEKEDDKKLKKIELMKIELMKIKFLPFKNKNNICWANAAITLVAHNNTFKKIVENCPESQINKIISAYEKATTIYNDGEENEPEAQKILLEIQNSTLKYLEKFLKFKLGKPDSAHNALLNLICRDKSEIKECLNISCIWKKQCSNCGAQSKPATYVKPIITIPKADNFEPGCPSSLYVCSCNSEQTMTLTYKVLPPCLIFHFENGVKILKNFPILFSVKNREYQVTGIVALKKSSSASVNHFVTWIRNPKLNLWLKLDDVKTGFSKFNPAYPDLTSRDVYLAAYEAFDNLDRINNDDNIDIEQEKIEISNVEVIDISDE